MSDVIANCACCGGKANLVGVGNHSWWICPNVACGIVGPNNDFDGAKWNALMRPSAAVAADAPDELTSTQPAISYRLLTSQDAIQSGDQALDDDCIHWRDLAGWEVGMKYTPLVLMPMRRRAALVRKEG